MRKKIIKQPPFITKLFFLIALFICSKAYAVNALSKCKPTPFHINNFEPSIFPTSNNLLRKSGETPLYCGERFIIRGKLVDKNCVPISDAKIYIWQVACDGKYPYQPLREVVSKKDYNIKLSTTFTGSGQATTDNKGEFYFITTYPASFHKQKPHINFRIKHRLLGEYDTRFFVNKDLIEDPPEEFATPYYKNDGTLTNEVVIVLPYEHPLREF